MTTVVAETRTARSTVAPDLFDQLVERITADRRVGKDHAEQVMDQALLFLHACAANPEAALVPSRAIDPGWHAFLLHTRAYAQFCRTYAGGFIHHQPEDPHGGPIGLTEQAATHLRTLDAIERTGYVVVPELWTLDSAKCSKCSASGKDCDENTETQLPS
ncbi:hypothetical protein [Frankia sp. Cppng1_Ct_nod]|uniref:glycine-rich domain-containing protein n=1 Tax=Frankia sp. Cppng1_Ct_nod TaxID=2897162 RepID=UPI001041413A|nr:hypothetical protein [Frankia sp. Cppng1_Ct_nod]